MREDFDQVLLVRMLHEGLLAIGGEGATRSGVSSTLRTLAIGSSADRYLAKIDEQLQQTQQQIVRSDDAEASDSGAPQHLQRQQTNLAALRQLVDRLLTLSQVETGAELLASAAVFLSELAYGQTELDNYARDGLLSDIHSMQRRQTVSYTHLTLPTKA